MNNPIVAFIADIISKRMLVDELAKRDLQHQYQGSYLGFVWMFLQPLLFILVLYMIFTLGFRAGMNTDVPFGLYLVSGMVAWLYFSGTLLANTDVIGSYAFLVKKMDFRLSILPIVKVLSALVAHFFLVGVAIVIAWIQGYGPSIYTLQLFYYLGAMWALLLGLGWLTSSTSLFIKDVSKLVPVLVQFGFWLTPIFWNISMIPEKYHWIVKSNPAYYIVSGYRESLLTRNVFWDRPVEGLYFWTVTLLFLLAGISVYRRLRPHFAEVV